MNPYNLIKLLNKLPEDTDMLHSIIMDLAAECPEETEKVLHENLSIEAFKFPNHENIPLYMVKELVKKNGQDKKVASIKDLRIRLSVTFSNGTKDGPSLKWAKEKVEEAMDELWGTDRSYSF